MPRPRAPGEWIHATDRHLGPYLAFLPDDLPPDGVPADRRLWAALERASGSLGRLREMEARLPAPELLAIYPSVREAHASARVEGTTTTLAQALGFEEPPADPQAQLDFRGIQDHLEAQAVALARARQGRTGPEALHEVHAILVRADPSERVEPGRWRRRQVIVPGERPGIQHARHVPPPPDEVPGKMAALFAFLDGASELPRLVQVALAHAQFELIHPYADGNGRIGRFLILTELVRHGAITSPVLFLSDYFRVFREAYFEHLHQIARHGSWDAWLAFFLVGVAEVADAARAVAETVLQLNTRLLRALPDVHQGEAGPRLLEQLYRTPRITVKSASERIGLGIAATNTAVNRFAEAGWLRQVTPGRRNRAFVFQPYWDALESAGQLDPERIQQRLRRTGGLPGAASDHAGS